MAYMPCVINTVNLVYNERHTAYMPTRYAPFKRKPWIKHMKKD